MSDLPLFISKLAWNLLSPGNILTLMLLAGAFMVSAESLRAQRLGHRLCFFGAMMLFLIMVLPIGEWAITPLENRFPIAHPDHVDGVILIGGDEEVSISEKRGVPVTFEATRRHLTFAALAHKYPNAQLVWSGGPLVPRKSPGLREADITLQDLTSLGISKDRVIVEDQSRDTYENAVFATRMVHPKPDQTWLLVTSAWHMPRAVACFRKAGWNVIPAPTGYFTTGEFSLHVNHKLNLTAQLYLLSNALHEYIGLAAYKLMGRTDELWPH